MDKLLTNLITAIISGADTVINSVFNSLIDTCFNAEEHLISLFGTQWIDFTNLKTIILSFSITLIILKFLKKGFDTYILWSEGDIDTPSLTFITYFARAIITAVSFPIVYDWLITISKGIANDILQSLNISAQQEIVAGLVKGAGMGIFGSIFAIIILIILFLLYIRLLMQGIELFVLKLRISTCLCRISRFRQRCICTLCKKILSIYINSSNTNNVSKTCNITCYIESIYRFNSNITGSIKDS